MKKLHLLFAGAFAALAIVACSDDELETETTTETETETDEGNTGEENTGEGEEAPEAYITLSEAELQFARTGGETTVTVDANYDWNAEYESDWFTVVADTGAGTLTVTCDANETGEVREGAVTVTAGDGEENVAEATLTITQEDFEAAALVLEYTIDEDGTEIQLPLGEKDYDGTVYTIDCTVDWGDGSEVETVTGSWPSHTYSAGTYTVIVNGTVELLCSWIYEGVFSRIIDGVECLTAVKQWGDTGLKSMDSAFQDCTNLASLPEGAGPFSDVTSFYSAFYECESLTAVPENMFSDCTAAENFKWIFYCCYNLTSAPSFKGLSNVTSFYGAFYGCESLTAVPEDMFSGCTAAENFEYVFRKCYNLTSAPSFKGLSNATDFWYAFWDCTSLPTLPEDMFSGCTAVEWFGPVFGDCTSLTTVPANLFADCPSVGSFYGVFYECTSLTSVPENLFANCPSVVDFEYAFAYCTSLTTVPENLFANCPSVEYFEGVFCDCESLETVPVGIFDNNKSVERFGYAFYDCPKLAGESPYTEIDVDGTPVKVHLYERENYSGSFTAPTYYEECFTGCTGLDDYYYIPSSWGGGASPTSVTPQSLNATDREELRPSHLGPHRDAMTPQERATRPLPTRK